MERKSQSECAARDRKRCKPHKTVIYCTDENIWIFPKVWLTQDVWDDKCYSNLKNGAKQLEKNRLFKMYYD